jgi:uncharacterized protein YcaQ
MSTPLRISAEHARRFLVTRHLLGPPRTLPAEAQSVLSVVERLGSLQFDPLEVPGPATMTLCSTLGSPGSSASGATGGFTVPIAG